MTTEQTTKAAYDEATRAYSTHVNGCASGCELFATRIGLCARAEKLATAKDAAHGAWIVARRAACAPTAAGGVR